jgi:pimeloyl-ACP methyl ester carboxylesterase
VLLAGLGDGAHGFDAFGPKLAADYHVYAITRRGFGNSTAAAAGFLADSLADDVLAVIDSLRLTRPVLVGHSIAGEELSSIGSRHPEKVSGLVYLDAAYNYAFYDSARTDLEMQIFDVYRKLLHVSDPVPPASPQDLQASIQVLLDNDLPRLERDLRAVQELISRLPDQNAAPPPSPVPQRSSNRAVVAGMQKYTSVRGPVLAIFAAGDSADSVRGIPRSQLVQQEAPHARVVTLTHATHYVFKSNEAAVIREIQAFVKSLSAP